MRFQYLSSFFSYHNHPPTPYPLPPGFFFVANNQNSLEVPFQPNCLFKYVYFSVF